MSDWNDPRTDEIINKIKDTVPHSITECADLLDEVEDYFQSYGRFTKKITDKFTTWELATGGWSDNEGIIDALQDNILWGMLWESSHRGGLYTFELRRPLTPQEPTDD